jgi:FHS family L-fucose permease-like MFS transporter
VGGAIVPLVAGNAADLWGLKLALSVPAFCYCGIFVFALYARRPLPAGVVETAT